MRRLVNGGLAATLSLMLVGATAGSGATPPSGTASTSLLGVELSVTGPAPADLSLLDITTLATTDPSRPLAEVALVPLRHDGQDIGAVRVSSENATNATTSPASLPGGPLPSADVHAVQLRATATAERAQAVVGAATGSLAAITDALGVDVDLRGVESLVTSERSSATQGLAVSGFDLSLGDLVPLEILELLPLDVLLQLAELLPVGIPGIDTIVTNLLDVERQLADAVAALRDTADDLEVELGNRQRLLDAQAAVDDAVAALQALGLSDDLIADLLDDPAGTVDAIVADPSLVGGIGGGLTPDEGGGGSGGGLQDTVDDIADGLLGGLSAAQVSAAATTALEDAIIDLVEAVEEQEDLEELHGTIAEVTERITDLVEDLTTIVTTIRTLIEDVLAGLLDLEGILPDLLAALEDSELVSVGDLEVALTSIAGATAADSSAEVACAAVDVTIAARTLSAPDCHTPLTGGSGSLSSLLTVVSDVLGLLPTTAVELPEVSFALFPDVVERVTEDGGTVTSEAGVTLLDLSLPSVSIDPAAVVDALVADLLDGLVAELLAQLPTGGELTGAGLPAELGTDLDAVLLELGGLTDVTDEILALLAELPLGLELPAFVTPGVDLGMASTSNAAFTPGDGTAPAPAPAPTPGGGDPSLPATGGGMALFGLAAIVAGAGLRRRR